jgi:hypothetical protein
MRHMRARLSYANVLSSVAIFIALGGGAYAASGSPGKGTPKVHGCYRTKGGALRVVSGHARCHKGEKALSLVQTGPAGAPGPQGTPGAPGTKGEAGPQGPGASGVAFTIEQQSEHRVTLPDGLDLKALCTVAPGKATALTLSAPNAGETLDVWGTAVNHFESQSIHDVGTAEVGVSEPSEADLDVTVYNVTTKRFSHVDAFGHGCTFEVMTTLTS